MSKWRVVWSDVNREHESHADDAAAVLETVRRLHVAARKPRPIVEILREPEGSPAIGLAVGGPESVLTFQATDDPPYYVSLGNPEREGESDPLCHGMQVIEHLARNLVPWKAAFEALEEFLRSEARPTNVEWESP